MAGNYERARANVNVAFPGLADKTNEEADRLIKEVGKEVASRVKSVAIAYMIIGGVAFFVCGGAYGVTKHYSFLVLAALAVVFVGFRVRSAWIAEIRLELHRRYGPSAVKFEDRSAA